MKCIVMDNVYIPGIGMGPILTPFDVNGRGIRNLIKNSSKNYVFFPDSELEKYLPKIESEIPQSEEITKQEIAEEEIIPEIEEETISPEIEDSIVVEEKEEVKKVFTKAELDEMTISELKKILEDASIDFLYKDTKATLIKKILENNL